MEAGEVKLRGNVPASAAKQAREELAGYYAHIEATDRSKMGRIHILEDAMSPVPAPPLEPLPPGLDFPRVANEAMRTFREAGMKVVKTTASLEG